MALLEPFIGLRYARGASTPPEATLTPPYDVISPERRRDLAHRSPWNFVHLDLPEAASGGDRYEAARAAYEAWRRDGHLVADPEPSFTLHRQVFTPLGGARRERIGLLGVMPLASEPDGSLRPHERTLPGPRSDRALLTRAVLAHLSPVFVLAPDPGGAFDRLLAASLPDPPQLSWSDDEGVRHEAAVRSDAEFRGRVAQLLAAHPLLIADGHHRYEAARAVRDALRRDLGAEAPATLEAGRLLVQVVSLASPGLVVLPTHRVVSSSGPFDGAALLSRLRSRYTVHDVPFLHESRTGARADLLRLLEARGSGTFGLAVAGGRHYHLVELGRAPVDSDPVARLDVSRVHGILREEFGISDAEVEDGRLLRYTRDAGAALDAVQEGSAAAAFLLTSTPLADLEAVTAAGLRMPPKSTYFHPKVPSGLVVHPFEL